MIKVGIAGYGNLGKGTALAVAQAPDMELCAVITRRDPGKLKDSEPGIPFMSFDEIKKGDVDVMILCGGSANDLPDQGPELASIFNTVDSFDTHAKIPEYLAAMNKAAVDTTAVISIGWDPGLFSIMRMLSGAILPNGETNTFWGKGVSQGHSSAIRGVEGVKSAVQYTVPIESAVAKAREGLCLPPNLRHTRECYVVPYDGADRDDIVQRITQMPHYFAGYDTKVHFITEEEMRRDHADMPHGGFVIRTGVTGESNRQLMEFSLNLDSNPEFTSSVLTAYARAAVRLSREGQYGAKTVFDIPISYLSPVNRETLIKELL